LGEDFDKNERIKPYANTLDHTSLLIHDCSDRSYRSSMEVEQLQQDRLAARFFIGWELGLLQRKTRGDYHRWLAHKFNVIDKNTQDDGYKNDKKT